MGLPLGETFLVWFACLILLRGVQPGQKFNNIPKSFVKWIHVMCVRIMCILMHMVR